MLLENQYNVGDIVEVNGFRGIVTSIGIRTTCITDSGDNVKIVNNSEMKNILNRSDNSSRAVGDISIPYETDLPKLEKAISALMTEIYKAHTDTLKGEPQYIGAYPEPERSGYVFTGWYRDPDCGGEPLSSLSPQEFFAKQNGETDWTKSVTVTLYAGWESID